MTFDEHADFILQSIASHDRQIAELHEIIGKLGADMREVHLAIDKTTANVDKLVAVSNQDAIDIQALARIAQSHEQRISRIEETR